ncbi:MAG: type II toxin-antitoxin system prevent-host-death family antitoxin, partial [Propionibacteriaceae bacterium]|nr:type II toxin-antitoxin system prevent-host-death family antitoxin [Propionibacteriaceae bacterium]
MVTIPVRELRNNTSDAIRRVEAGETVVLTSRGV